MPLNPEVMDAARAWLIEQQRSDGTWADKQGNEDAVLTAYVAHILAKTANDKASDALKRAFDFLSERAKEEPDSYLLASYALAAIEAGDKSAATEAVNALRLTAHQEGGTTYWSPESATPFHGWVLQDK